MIKKYNSQRRRSAQRNIDWNFTYESWLQWWESSGHIHERGKGGDQYCMARHNDIGPYDLSNVSCITNRENARLKDHSITSAKLKNKPAGWDKETRDKQRATKSTPEWREWMGQQWKDAYTPETAAKKSSVMKSFWANMSLEQKELHKQKIKDGMKK